MAIFRTRSILKAYSLLFVLIAAVLLTGCSEPGNPEADSRSADTHLKNSEKYIKQGQYRAAMLEVRNAIKKSPTTDSIGSLVDIYNELGQYRAAQSLLEQNVAQFPELNLHLAQTYLALGKYYSAEEALTKVNTSASSAAYALAQAKILVGKGELEDGLKKLTQLHQTYPNNVDIAIAQFTAVFNSGTPQASEDALNALVTQYPAESQVLFTAAKVRFMQKDYTATEAHLMQALHQSKSTDILTPLRTGILNLLSKTLTQQGRYADALPFEKILKEANPNVQDIQTRLEEAIAKIQGGDIQGGEELLQKLNQDFPNIDSASALLGLVSLELGDASKASDLFAHSIDPETAAPRLSAAAAMAELRLDEKTKALDILEKAIKTNPGSVQLQSIYGLTAIGIPEKQASGAAALQEAIALGSPEMQLYEVLTAYHFQVTRNTTKGVELLRKAEQTFSGADEQLKIYANYIKYGQEDEAKRYAANLKASQQNNEAGWLMTAANDIKERSYSRANKQLYKAVEINPNSEKAWYLLGSNELKLGNQQAAANAFKKAAKLNPNSRNYVLGLLTAETQQNRDWNDIVTSITSLANNEEHKVRLNGFLAEYAIGTGNFDNARARIKSIKNLSASTTEQIAYLETRSLAAQAKQLASSGKINTAITLLEEGRRKYQDSVLLAVALGNYYLQQGELSKAQKIQLQMTKMDDAVVALLFDADIMVKSGKTKAASDKLTATWQNNRDPRLAQAIYKLSLQQKSQLSDSFVEQWQAADPKNFRPVLIQAMSAQTARSDEAQSLYERVLALSPRNVPALNNLAWIYQEKGKLEQADKLATLALELAPESASVLDTAGYIKLKMGDKSAIALLEKAMSLAPDEKEIKAHYNLAKKSL